jgi:hypothetical protein
LTVDEVRAKTPRKARSIEGPTPQINMSLASECRAILSHAAEEATNLNHRYIGTEHLLLGILREENTLASSLVRDAGIDLEGLRERVAADVSDQQTPGQSGGITVLGGREVVHAMIDELPESMLVFVKEAIDRTVSSVRPIRPFPTSEAPPEGRSSTSRYENGDVVVETRHVAGGHQIVLTERLHLSPDGTRLSYVQEIAGPKPDQKHKNTIEFDIS